MPVEAMIQPPEMTFVNAMARTRSLVSDRLHQIIPMSATLGQPMLYALNGGKMLRAFLVLEGARLNGISEDVALDAAVAIECMHAYSLVHDDLPCMDNDDLRRGQPTVHRKWDEATAVLTGDALQTLAFDLLADPKLGPHALDLIRLLARAAGRSGMVAGQMLDIAAETAATSLELDDIIALQERKTGCLITWSATAGAVLAGNDSAALRRYAQALGLAFQITDDILDIEGDEEKVGKRLQKDTTAGKATFVSLLGLNAARARAQDLIDQACAALEVYGNRADTLRDAARFVISRDS
jgi:farnesyl diphosphate synthase